MAYTLTVPRTFGGTLLITFTPSTAPTAVTIVTAFARDGIAQARGRDGVAQARGRDGIVQGKGH